MASFNTLLRKVLNVNNATFSEPEYGVDAKGQEVLRVQARLHKRHEASFFDYQSPRLTIDLTNLGTAL